MCGITTRDSGATRPARRPRRCHVWSARAAALGDSAARPCGARGGNTLSNARTAPPLWKSWRRWSSAAARGVRPNGTRAALPPAKVVYFFGHVGLTHAS